jgi:hypothetical protein
MTFGRIATLARQWSRVDTVGVSDSEVFDQINEAVSQFAIDVFGLPMEDYLTIAARFDMRTTMAFHLEMTDGTLGNVDADVDVTDSNADDRTGTQAATELQAQIQAAGNAAASVTVAWSNYKFTLTIPATTTVLSIGAPEGVDKSNACDKFFGGTYDEDDISSNEIECAFPESATMIASLPTSVGTIQSIDAVYWDDHELTEIQPRRIRWGEAHGTPWDYARRGDEILLYPSPSEQEECLILFRGVPAAVSSPTSSSDIPSTIPARYQTGIARLLASWLAEGEFEHAVAIFNEKKYLHMKNKYIGDYSMHITANRGKPTSNRLWYKVNV